MPNLSKKTRAEIAYSDVADKIIGLVFIGHNLGRQAVNRICVSTGARAAFHNQVHGNVRVSRGQKFGETVEFFA